MTQRIEEILCCLDGEMNALRATVDRVPEALHQQRPAPDRWSVAEVLEHLGAVEATILKACIRQLAAARERGLGAETDTSSVLHTLSLERVAARDTRITAPETLRPKGMTASAAWVEIETVRGRFKEFIVSSDGLALGDVVFPHPVLGPFNLYQWFLFAAGHHARHAAQIREIAEQLS